MIQVDAESLQLFFFTVNDLMRIRCQFVGVFFTVLTKLCCTELWAGPLLLCCRERKEKTLASCFLIPCVTLAWSSVLDSQTVEVRYRQT